MILPVDFKRTYARYGKEIDRVIKKVFRSGLFILGPELERFEKEFARYLGVRHVIGVNSGTDALHLSLQAYGIGPGDEVITVSHTATPTVSAIRMSGATPVFVDVRDEDMVMNTELLERALTKRTKAVIPVHLYGHPVSMERVRRFSRAHGLKTVEDVAQAAGGSYRHRKLGTWSDVGCFSFYPTKNLGAFGDAGAVATNNKRTADLVRSLRCYGEVRKYENVREGINSRMVELQAALLNWGLPKLDGWNRTRQRLAAIYRKELAGLPVRLPPTEDADREPVWHLFVIRTTKRDRLQAYLKEHGIVTLVHYPTPVFRQKAYRFLGYRDTDLPVTARLAHEVLSLPLHPEMTIAEVDAVCRTVRKFYGA